MRRVRRWLRRRVDWAGVVFYAALLFAAWLEQLWLAVAVVLTFVLYVLLLVRRDLRR